MLDAFGVLAVPGEVEHSLNGIVEEIQSANGIAGPAIKCRVLLTTPVEIFSIRQHCAHQQEAAQPRARQVVAGGIDG